MKVVNRLKGLRTNTGQDKAEAESIGAVAFSFLASEPEYFSRFASITGVDLADMAEISGTKDFLGGVLEYLMSDESLLLSFCENAGIQPETVHKSQLILAGNSR